MKYLSDYTSEGQTILMEETGAFFAFSPEQFNEKAVPGTKYISSMGFYVPKDKYEYLQKALEENYRKGIAQDISENGIKAIIHRELGNHECQLTGDSTSVQEGLYDYGITAEDVAKEWPSFYQNCVDNDYF